MSSAPETIAAATTSRGQIALREVVGEGGPVHELVIAGIFAMNSLDTSTETALAQRALERVDSPARVLVAGLGLGFTTWQVLKDKRVREVDVVEVEEDLIAWARLGLTPTLGVLARHPRVRLHATDVADVLGVDRPVDGAVNPATPPGPWDLILLDVDNGPSLLVHQVNERLYAAAALAAAVAALAPGGVLAIWAAQREPTLHARLTRIAPTQEILLPVERGGRALECALYITHPPSGPPR